MKVFKKTSTNNTILEMMNMNSKVDIHSSFLSSPPSFSGAASLSSVGFGSFSLDLAFGLSSCLPLSLGVAPPPVASPLSWSSADGCFSVGTKKVSAKGR